MDAKRGRSYREAHDGKRLTKTEKTKQERREKSESYRSG